VNGFVGALVAAATLFAAETVAQEPVKVGLLAPFSGTAAGYGKQMEFAADPASLERWLEVRGQTPGSDPGV